MSEENTQQPEWQSYAQPNSESSNEWGTPPEIWRPLSQAIGGFDLDPCSGAEPVPIAEERYTKEDNGLKQKWFGQVWVNPPYSDPSTWIEKAVEEYEREDVERILMLLPARTNTNYFSKYVTRADYVLFYDHKVQFLKNGEKSSDYLPSPVCLLLFGQMNEDMMRVMNENGWVVDIEEQTVTLSDFSSD